MASSQHPHGSGHATAVEFLVRSIDHILPQTQCTQCGYQGCKPYAEAIARGNADINQCPPGGNAGIHALADLLQRPYKPLNPDHGEHKPKALAVIDEQVCIGCTLCIQACPVDAIIGAPKQMHTVIAAHCTGCELCVAPCPVDCIDMAPMAQPPAYGSPAMRREADMARQRHEFHLFRIERDKQARTERHAQKAAQQTNASNDAAALAKKAAIAAAMERVRAQKAAVQPRNTEKMNANVAAEIAAIDARRAKAAETVQSEAESGSAEKVSQHDV